jgi:hypothetical protein
MTLSNQYLIQRYLRDLAEWVWSEQDDAFNFGLKLQEETLTETLLLRMARETKGLPLHINLFTRNEEGGDSRAGADGTGADWEWFVETQHCSVGFRVQAKILSRTLTAKKERLAIGKYASIKNKQVETLIESAENNNFNPIFVFYNHPWISDRHLFYSARKGLQAYPKDWGCSVVEAKDILNAKNKNLSGLIHHMWPRPLFFRLGPNCGVGKGLHMSLGGGELSKKAEKPGWLDQSGEGDVGAAERERGVQSYLSEHGLAGFAYFKLLDE